jgi:hypothetical protein
MARRKLKRSAVTLAGPKGPVPHDRRAIDITKGARIAVVDVEDPYEKGVQITVVRNLRDDPLAAMHNRRWIDHCQYMAGRRWQRLWELSQGHTVQAIDPSKDAVDGGQIAQSTVTDTQIQASDELKEAMHALGMIGEKLVRDVLADCLSLQQCAVKRGQTSVRDSLAMGRRFRECLDTLAVVFGYAKDMGHKEPQPDMDDET